jgi:hypothetical protein
MFEGFKQRQAQKLAEATLNKTNSAIKNLSELPPPLLHFARSGLISAHDGLVDQYGPFEEWSKSTRTAAMSQLTKMISAAQKIRGGSIGDQATMVGSFGAQLLFFYYDSMEMVEPKSVEIRDLIATFADFDPS